MTLWSGDIALDAQRSLRGVSLLRTGANDRAAILAESSLKFLSLVETDRVPLHLCAGAPYSVNINDEQTGAYLSSVLLPVGDFADNQTGTAWWQGARGDSPLGLLIACDEPIITASASVRPRVTELLFYASRNHRDDKCGRLTPPHSPDANPSPDTILQTNIAIYAVPLSSDLITNLDASTTISPSHGGPVEPTFISCAYDAGADAEAINMPPTRKRKSLDDTFDEAAERRRKARRIGIENAAASGQAQTLSGTLPSLKHRRATSSSHSVPIQTRPLSRASSISNPMQGGSREASLPATTKRSGLSRVKSVSNLPENADKDSTETKNKEVVSRVVMAGMRLYGFSQSKSRKSRAESISQETSELAETQSSDEEYKLLYHQVYKATCFAFRRQMQNVALLGHSEALRETADKLLAVFCADPLSTQIATFEDEVTPGGRKVFGTTGSLASGTETFSVSGPTGRSVENTPCNGSRTFALNVTTGPVMIV